MIKKIWGEDTINSVFSTEQQGILARKVIETRPPRVEYSLTEKGKEVAEILQRLNEVL